MAQKNWMFGMGSWSQQHVTLKKENITTYRVKGLSIYLEISTPEKQE